MYNVHFIRRADGNDVGARNRGSSDIGFLQRQSSSSTQPIIHNHSTVCLTPCNLHHGDAKEPILVDFFIKRRYPCVSQQKAFATFQSRRDRTTTCVTPTIQAKAAGPIPVVALWSSRQSKPFRQNNRHFKLMFAFVSMSVCSLLLQVVSARELGILITFQTMKWIVPPQQIVYADDFGFTRKNARYKLRLPLDLCFSCVTQRLQQSSMKGYCVVASGNDSPGNGWTQRLQST
jgi:hypothetical protein